MNSEKLKEIRKTIKDLHNKNILLLDLNIVFELDCQLTSVIEEDEYLKLYNEIEHAYLRLENVTIETIVYCAINNKDKILNDDEDFDLIEESCYLV